MGFKVDFVEDGRPAYHPKDLLKLYLYGYLNSIRSSRKLEKETQRNIEVMWLLKGLSPDHNTISNFRRDNPKAIKKVFRATVSIAKNFELIGGKLIAGDSTKLRAQNSKKNNFNEKKIKRHLEYIDEKLARYEKQLSDADGDNRKLIASEIEKHKHRKKGYQQIQDQLDKREENQVSTSDPESRQLITRNNITEVAYNVQTTVDSKNNILIDYNVEHPYGTIKRQWGFNYILTKKLIKRAEADVGLMFTAYNLRRLMNILEKEVLKEYMKTIISLLINMFRVLWLKISLFKQSGFFDGFPNKNRKQLLLST